MACNTCTHPTCPQSAAQNAVCGCTQPTCEGELVFDPSSGPLWKFCCNSCNSVLLVAEKAKLVNAQNSFCEDCGSREFEVEFHKDSPLANKGKILGCFFCDEPLNSTSKSL
jgi:DNA topoisomerase-3